ncbi:MAG: VWA domain-containing protein [Verrucomicrobia bacterium]|nr:VWA domain-containing protein [Verrucomicrobiota bacterium]
MKFLTQFPLNFLADTAGVERTWKLDHEGLQPAWSFLIFLVLAALTIAAYLRCTPAVRPVRKTAMAALRLASAALLAALLTKPVIRLTEYNPVKQPLAVVVDASRSMALTDRRDAPRDQHRAAIAAGLVDPASDLAKPLAADLAGQVAKLSRHDLVARLGENRKLDLWSRLATRSELRFYEFGGSATPLGAPEALENRQARNQAPTVIFPKIGATASVTAIGEALRQVIQEPRSQALGGVILVTDGGNNHGASPMEAAQIAREQNVPLFIYGVGVTSPPDIEVSEVTAQSLAFVGERLEVHAKIASRSLDENPSVATLKADGETVNQVDLTIGGDHIQDVVCQFVPKKTGDVKLEVSVPLRDEEVGRDNNTAATTARITDKKFHVLLVEQAPRWDFRFLLDYLQRDPRLVVKSVMIDGEPGLAKRPDSPFLPSLPATRESLFASQVLILGDVNPTDLGHERMAMIVDWVEAGGGIIFLAGSNFNPASYLGTPLEALLPIIPDIRRPHALRSQREATPFPLELTPAGRRSPYLQMDPDPAANQRIWDGFPGVRWAAPVARVKPGAEVLLADPRPTRAGRYGKLPVLAMQGYGSGKCVYFGTDETYRWRSRTGGKYYSILWGQIMQTLALRLLDSASPLTQLRTDRKQYDVGERVVIAGNAYTGNYEPLILPSLEGVLALTKPGAETPVSTRNINLSATARNFFRCDFIVSEPGAYVFHTVHDPGGILKFEVIDPNLESKQTALDDRLLKNMAATAGGRFLREEDLRHLPAWVSATSIRVASYRKVELYYSVWILAGLLTLLFAEWLLRRLSRLK